MFSIVIQAGGKSSRMGVEKSLLPFAGFPLIQWVIARVSTLTDDLLVISNNPDLGKDVTVPVYPDLLPGRGPLGGLFTGFHYARNETVAVIACDMPFVNPRLLMEEANLLAVLNVDVVIPAPDGNTEPLHAVYRKSTCQLAVAEALEAGMSRLIEWHPQIRVHQMEADAIRQFDPQSLAFFNINTPDDLKLAEELNRKRSSPVG